MILIYILWRKVGGMLFILDDISTFFQQDMFLRILVANAVGTFCLAYYKGDLSYYGAINFADYTGKKDDSIENQFMEVPWWILLGILLGTLGGIFCKAYGIIKKWSGKRFNTPGRLYYIIYIYIYIYRKFLSTYFGLKKRSHSFIL